LGGQIDLPNFGQGRRFIPKSKVPNQFFNFCTQTVILAKPLGTLAVKHTILNCKYE